MSGYILRHSGDYLGAASKSLVLGRFAEARDLASRAYDLFKAGLRLERLDRAARAQKSFGR